MRIGNALLSEEPQESLCHTYLGHGTRNVLGRLYQVLQGKRGQADVVHLTCFDRGISSAARSELLPRHDKVRSAELQK